jgi:uncharacterized SAM-binding protein YcdF (DUF218 family)
VSEFLRQIFSIFLVPPGLFITFLLLSIFLVKSLRVMKWVLTLQLLLIYLLSIPFTSDVLFTQLENSPALTETQIKTADADVIVLLAGGITAYANEYHGPDIAYFTNERLRYAAWLQKKTGLPMIVTGGIDEEGVTEAELMKKVLRNEYEIKVPIWVENRSQNTFENAQYSNEIMQQQHYQRYYLVTNAFHMKRALEVFSKQNNAVTPAPMSFYSQKGDYEFGTFVPHSYSLWKNFLAMHEIVGRYWYRFYYD